MFLYTVTLFFTFCITGRIFGKQIDIPFNLSGYSNWTAFRLLRSLRNEQNLLIYKKEEVRKWMNMNCILWFPKQLRIMTLLKSEWIWLNVSLINPLIISDCFKQSLRTQKRYCLILWMNMTVRCLSQKKSGLKPIETSSVIN